MAQYYLSVILGVIIIAVLAFDLGLFQKNAHEFTMKAAIAWSVFWVGFALVFNLLIYIYVGEKPALEFLSGYLVEKSLSVDNLFVFLLIFTYFRVPNEHQHKVLVWGIAGAIVMRGLLIYLGIQLIQNYHWLTYVLGAFLVFTGYKTATKGMDELDIEHKPILRMMRRFLPISTTYIGGRFIAKQGGKWVATPLFVVLVMIETTDVLFALDSIPAILAITVDPFVLYTSNLFAILGLRALYFVLASLMQTLHFLSYGVSLVLVFVGTKMLIAPWFNMPEWVTLSVIAGCILGSAALSILRPKKDPPTLPEHEQKSV